MEASLRDELSKLKTETENQKKLANGQITIRTTNSSQDQ